jgi:hypothetical protein
MLFAVSKETVIFQILLLNFLEDKIGNNTSILLSFALKVVSVVNRYDRIRNISTIGTLLFRKKAYK